MVRKCEFFIIVIIKNKKNKCRIDQKINFFLSLHYFFILNSRESGGIELFIIHNLIFFFLRIFGEAGGFLNRQSFSAGDI